MNREKEILEVSIDDIIPNRFQPRLSFDEKELKDLSDSIKLHGIIQPLVLRRIGNKYEIIAGERRYKAASMAGLIKVPAIIMEIDDNQSAELAVVENLQRKNLSAIEEAQSFKKILDKGYLTQDQLATRMGVSQPTIANKMRLLNLPDEVQQALLRNQISERHARSLLSLPDPSTQIGMLRRIIAERMTVKQTDDEISKILGRTIVTEQIEPQKIEEMPSQVTMPQENIKTDTNIFDVNSENPTDENIIKQNNVADIDMLLKKEGTIEEPKLPDPPSKVSLEDEAANVEMGDIVNKEIPINPFQEKPNPVTEKPKYETPNLYDQPTTQTNPLIEEFKQQKAETFIEPNTSPTNSFSTVINLSRETIRKIESLGFVVNSEEFDFEDMYQIIIKIQKN